MRVLPPLRLVCAAVSLTERVREDAEAYVRLAPPPPADGSFLDDYLYAVEAATGTLLWKVSVDGTPSDSPAVGVAGTLFFGTAGNNGLYAMGVAPAWSPQPLPSATATATPTPAPAHSPFPSWLSVYGPTVAVVSSVFGVFILAVLATVWYKWRRARNTEASLLLEKH